MDSTQKINILPLDIGESNNTLLRDVRFSLNLSKIQRDHSTGKGFNGTGRVLNSVSPMTNQIENINKSQKNSANNLDVRRSSLLRTSQLPSSRSQRSTSQMYLKQILPQAVAPSVQHTPNVNYSLMTKRSRGSQNYSLANNSSLNKENIPLNSHRLSTQDNSEMIDQKSTALNSARISNNLPLSSCISNIHSHSLNKNGNNQSINVKNILSNNTNNNNISQNNINNSCQQISKQIIRKFSKQIKQIQDESEYVNNLYKKQQEQVQNDIQHVFSQIHPPLPINHASSQQSSSHQLNCPQANFSTLQSHIIQYLNLKTNHNISLKDNDNDDESQFKNFIDNIQQFMNQIDSYQQKQKKIHEYIKQTLSESYNSLCNIQNKEQIGIYQLNQCHQKTKRCIQIISQNGLNSIFPSYVTSIQDISEFQNNLLQFILANYSSSKFDDDTEQAIIKKKAQDSRKLMDLEEKLEELKIENELLKKQRIQQDEQYHDSMNKLKKENKEIQKQNRDIYRENKKLKEDIDILRIEQEQSMMYHTKNNFQNMSYFDSVHNMTISEDDKKKTLQPFQFITQPQTTIQENNRFISFDNKFWYSLHQFNINQIKHSKCLDSKEVHSIILKSIDDNIKQPIHIEFSFISSLITQIKDRYKVEDILGLTKGMMEFQNSYGEQNTFNKLFFDLNEVTIDENIDQISPLLLIEDNNFFKNNLKSNIHIYQKIFLSIYKLLLEESSKTITQREGEISLSQLIQKMKKLSYINNNQYQNYNDVGSDYSNKISLPLLLNKCQIYINDDSMKDKNLFMMLIHGYLMNKQKQDKDYNKFNKDSYESFEQFYQTFMNIDDFCSQNIQNLFQQQSNYDRSSLQKYYNMLNQNLQNKQNIYPKIFTDIESKLNKSYISILDASFILLSLITQKIYLIQSSLSKVYNLNEDENRKYEINKILKQYEITVEQYDIWEREQRIYQNTQKINNHQQGQHDTTAILQQQIFNQSSFDISYIMRSHLNNILIEYYYHQLLLPTQQETIFDQMNSVRSTSISGLNSRKSTDFNQDSFLALTQPQKLFVHTQLQKH